LINDQGDVVSLVLPMIGPGPFAIVVDEPFIPCLDPAMPVGFDRWTRMLSIGSWQIEIEDAEIWNSRPQWDNLRHLPLAGETASASEAASTTLRAELEGHLQCLLQGVMVGDRTLCQAGAFGLAGLGSGLTPSGDDVLMGVLYGLWVWYPYREWMDMIVETAVLRTTSLSAAFLRAAAEGEATIHWHRLADGDETAVEQLLSIGHTSGRDAWTGFTRTGAIMGNWTG
jgi:hypothetical protein